jgi:23S rRNA (uracil1939-C5)-methyltransferase
LLLNIDKLVYGGDGLARMPDGRAVFLPFVLEGEQVQAEILDEKRSFVRAHPQEITSAAVSRIEPGCPYFERCGGCHYQHTGYEHQLEIKSAVLRETLRRQGKLEWDSEIQLHPSPPWQYRNRTCMQVLREPEFSLAYFRFASHELLAIEQCPISSPLINRAIIATNELGPSAIHASIGEIEFFTDHDDARLMFEFHVGGPHPDRRDYQKCFEALRTRLPEIACLAVFVAAQPALPPAKPVLTFGDANLLYRTATDSYRVSPGAFFQTNRHMTATLVELATRNSSGKLAFDLYAGVGLFSLPLARSFERVIAVEAAPVSAADLRRNAGERITVENQTTESFLRQPARHAPDYVVVDPPRAGLGERIARQLAARAVPQLTYVSCDPATLARDLRILLASGYRVDAIHLVDLFPQTFHIEAVVHLSR